MIYCLTGKIVKKSMSAVVLSCGGVGYYAQCPASVAGALPGVGKEATLYTVMSVTENDVSLYGFATEEQQACFEMLTAVSGVGPKVGLAILSVMEPQRVALAISAGDHKAFKAANGVGPKLAQRIVLEPVSYTHLDVYKRQDLPCIANLAVLLRQNCFFIALFPAELGGTTTEMCIRDRLYTGLIAKRGAAHA